MSNVFTIHKLKRYLPKDKKVMVRYFHPPCESFASFASIDDIFKRWYVNAEVAKYEITEDAIHVALREVMKAPDPVTINS